MINAAQDVPISNEKILEIFNSKSTEKKVASLILNFQNHSTGKKNTPFNGNTWCFKLSEVPGFKPEKDSELIVPNYVSKNAQRAIAEIRNNGLVVPLAAFHEIEPKLDGMIILKLLVMQRYENISMWPVQYALYETAFYDFFY